MVHGGGAIHTDCEPNRNVEAMRLALLDENVESRPLWKPMHLQPVYRRGEVQSSRVQGSRFKVMNWKKVFHRMLDWYFSRKALPYWCVLLTDSLTLFVSGFVSYCLFHRGMETLQHSYAIATAMLVYVVLSWTGMRMFHTYSGIVRYASFVDLRRVARANGLAFVLAFAAHYAMYLLPETAVAHLNVRELLVAYLTATALMCGVRVLIKTLYEVTTSDGKAMRCLIYGTMTGGVAFWPRASVCSSRQCSY